MNTTFENCTLLDTKTWFEKARPECSEQDRQSQLGVHLEEVVEMLDQLTGNKASIPLLMGARRELHNLAELIKSGKAEIQILDHKEYLDAICDQIVTGTGIAHTQGYDIVGAMTAVNASNFSKFDEAGNPIRNEHGKIMKGPNYYKVELQAYLPQ